MDREAARFVAEGQDRATELLKKHQDELDQLGELLLETGTVDGQKVYDLVGRFMPGRLDPVRPLVGDTAATAIEDQPAWPAAATGEVSTS